MPLSASAIACTDLGFSWPDGSAVLSGLTTSFPSGLVGLVGRNGSGKSTLLELIAGRRQPTGGSISVSGSVGYLPQTIPLTADATVAGRLGIGATLDALERIEGGDTAPELFDLIGTDWDVAERAQGALDQLGLAGLELHRPLTQLSGGEAVLLALAAQLLARPEVLLLDEPTNNLDRAARGYLAEAVLGWRGSVIVVSHDRELLELAEHIGELRSGRLSWYGGNFCAYAAAVAAEQQTAQRLVRAAGQEVRRQERELIEARVALDRRARYGRRMAQQKREPKIVMGARQRQAQVSAGKLRTGQERKVEQARQQLVQAEQAIRAEREIRIDLPETAVPAGRDVLALRRVELRTIGPVDFDLRGPERVALTGRNGAGKTTLLELLAGRAVPEQGSVEVAVPVRYLPQRLDLLDPGGTVLDNLRRLAPAATDNRLRAGLARFLFRGSKADQLVGTLSGGERFRASLAALLLAEPAPQLLLLDEPTNNLDLVSVEELVGALSGYRGALIVASHDPAFLAELNLTRRLHLDRGLIELSGSGSGTATNQLPDCTA